MWSSLCLQISWNIIAQGNRQAHSDYKFRYRHMATEIWVNIGSCIGLLPNGTKPLPEPMLTYHQIVLCYSHKSNFKEIAQDINSICEKITLLDPNPKVGWWHHNMELYYWPFVRGIPPSPVDSPHKVPVMRTFDSSFDTSLNNYRQTVYWVVILFAWRSCAFIVMKTQRYPINFFSTLK